MFLTFNGHVYLFALTVVGECVWTIVLYSSLIYCISMLWVVAVDHILFKHCLVETVIFRLGSFRNFFYNCFPFSWNNNSSNNNNTSDLRHNLLDLSCISRGNVISFLFFSTVFYMTLFPLTLDTAMAAANTAI